VPAHPAHPKRLVGSKWTAVEVVDRERHWVVVALEPRRTGGERRVTLEAVLTGSRRARPWRELRDRAVWRPGWRRAESADPAGRSPPEPEAP